MRYCAFLTRRWPHYCQKSGRHSAMIKKVKDIFSQGVIRDNPVFRQILGICSALAVTNLMLNSLAMGLGLIFVSSLSSLTVSLLRRHTPGHIRMMVQVLIISAYVIIVDIVLK